MKAGCPAVTAFGPRPGWNRIVRYIDGSSVFMEAVATGDSTMAAAASAEIIDLAAVRARRAARMAAQQPVAAMPWAFVWVVPCMMWVGMPDLPGADSA
jgi:hypothetical protein